MHSGRTITHAATISLQWDDYFTEQTTQYNLNECFAFVDLLGFDYIRVEDWIIINSLTMNA